MKPPFLLEQMIELEILMIPDDERICFRHSYGHHEQTFRIL